MAHPCTQIEHKKGPHASVLMAASTADHGQLILDIETNMLEAHAPMAIISYDSQATVREGGS
eukprot:5805524-Prymnesium_polylepis.1